MRLKMADIQMATKRSRSEAGMSKKSGDSDEKKYKGGVFECSNCKLKERYHYFGRKPPFARHFFFKEEAYIARDLLSPREESLFLLLGGNCKTCEKPVCQKQECSIFYTNRYCISCLKSNLNQFPEEIIKLVEKTQNTE